MKPTYQTPNILSPEMIQANVQYTLTLSPDDDRQFWSVDDRPNAVRKYYTHILQTLEAICDIDMQIECSRTGRLHYHGIIMFHSQKSITNFFVYHIHRLLLTMQIEIDTIESKEKWNDYINKSSLLFPSGRLTSNDVKKNKPMPPIIKHKDYFTKDIPKELN